MRSMARKIPQFQDGSGTTSHSNSHLNQSSQVWLKRKKKSCPVLDALQKILGVCQFLLVSLYPYTCIYIYINTKFYYIYHIYIYNTHTHFQEMNGPRPKVTMPRVDLHLAPARAGSAGSASCIRMDRTTATSPLAGCKYSSREAWSWITMEIKHQ